MCFHTGLKPSLEDKLLLLLWLKPLWNRLSLTWESSQWTSKLSRNPLYKCFDKSVMFGWFYNTFTDHPQFSGLVKHPKRVIKTQLEKIKKDSLGKIVEPSQTPWPTALPLVLVQLRTVPSGAHTFSPFMAVGCPVCLAPAPFDTQKIKGEGFQYC